MTFDLRSWIKKNEPYKMYSEDDLHEISILSTKDTVQKCIEILEDYISVCGWKHVNTKAIDEIKKEFGVKDDKRD